jgi:hypothetical protein
MLLVLQGPTTDFIVGRVFESASNLAFDDIVKTNDAGLTLEKMSDWVMDKEAQKIKAHSKFVGTNCALIK